MFWFAFRKNELLVERKPDGSYTVPDDDSFPLGEVEPEVMHGFASLHGMSCKAVRMAESVSAGIGQEWVDLRASFDMLSPELYRMAGKASEILYWDSQTQFCGVCGAPVVWHSEISKQCTSCGQLLWPQLATAIIVLVRRGDSILMVRAHNFRGSFYGLVAGFVETGESLEECVRREVWEETRVRVKNIRYVASQPWPYPCGLMVGFCADYDNGDIQLQKEELAAGGWFNRSVLPQLPGKASLARQMIDFWLAGRLPE